MQSDGRSKQEAPKMVPFTIHAPHRRSVLASKENSSTVPTHISEDTLAVSTLLEVLNKVVHFYFCHQECWGPAHEMKR